MSTRVNFEVAIATSGQQLSLQSIVAQAERAASEFFGDVAFDVEIDVSRGSTIVAVATGTVDVVGP